MRILFCGDIVGSSGRKIVMSKKMKSEIPSHVKRMSWGCRVKKKRFSKVLPKMVPWPHHKTLLNKKNALCFTRGFSLKRFRQYNRCLSLGNGLPNSTGFQYTFCKKQVWRKQAEAWRKQVALLQAIWARLPQNY